MSLILFQIMIFIRISCISPWNEIDWFIEEINNANEWKKYLLNEKELFCQILNENWEKTSDILR